jgi:hypothetical protein
MAGPLSLRDALAQGNGWSEQDLRDRLQNQFLPKDLRQRTEEALDRMVRDRSEQRQIRSQQIQESQKEKGLLEAGKRRTEGLPMWHPKTGMQYPLSKMLSGADESLKRIPTKHANYLSWGRDIARGLALKNADGSNGRAEWDKDYSARHDSSLEVLYDEYLGKVEGGGTITLGVKPRGWKRKPGPLGHRRSPLGNPFLQGGVDEGGFMSWAAERTKLPPLVVGSWLRSKLNDREQSGERFLDEAAGQSNYLDRPQEEDTPFSRENYNRFYKKQRDQNARRTANEPTLWEQVTPW